VAGLQLEGAAIIFIGDQFSMPRQQRFRRDNRGDLCEDFPSESYSFRRKPSSLIVSKSKTPTTDLLPQDTIFLNQIFNDLLLALVQPTSEGNDEK